MFGLRFLKSVFGWWALVLIAAAIGLAELLGGMKWVRRLLWVAAAVFAAAGAINEWGRSD
jgi:hypothetical protein